MKYLGKIAQRVFTSRKETAKPELEEKGEISASYILFSGCDSTFSPEQGKEHTWWWDRACFVHL